MARKRNIELKLSKLCAARNLAANRRREAISTDVRTRDALSWEPCGSGDEIELVPKQPRFIEA